MVTAMLELSGKDSKAAIIKMSIMNTLEIHGEKNKQRENLKNHLELKELLEKQWSRKNS